MKARTGFNLLMLVLAVATLSATGCKRKPVQVTPLPGSRAGQVPGPGAGNIMDAGQGAPLGGDTGVNAANLNSTPTGIAQGEGHPGWAEDREMFKSGAVYFDYDSSTIKASEHSKIEAVAAYLKGASSSVAVKVEGNCDERGTEEYNRSLGERRALAIREYLVRSGVTPDRADTVSYGEDKPAASGHDEAAWKQNRRGDFVVLTAPK